MVWTERLSRTPSLGTQYIGDRLREMGHEDVSAGRVHQLLNLGEYATYFSLCAEARTHQKKTGGTDPDTESRIQTLREELFKSGWKQEELDAAGEIVTTEFLEDNL